MQLWLESWASPSNFALSVLILLDFHYLFGHRLIEINSLISAAIKSGSPTIVSIIRSTQIVLSFFIQVTFFWSVRAKHATAPISKDGFQRRSYSPKENWFLTFCIFSLSYRLTPLRTQFTFLKHWGPVLFWRALVLPLLNREFAKNLPTTRAKYFAAKRCKDGTKMRKMYG